MSSELVIVHRPLTLEFKEVTSQITQMADDEKEKRFIFLGRHESGAHFVNHNSATMSDLI